MEGQTLMDLQSGTILQDGKYTIERILGQGALGITYQATHVYWGKPVVLKILNPTLRNYPNFNQFQRQFVAEAHRLSQCQHPHLARILDFFHEGGVSFIVMEYIPGQTLAELVQPGQTLPLSQALHYITQVGEALKIIHQQGLLHRDIKPANIRIRADSDIAMLTDFGIARDFPPGSRQTHSNLISAGYVSREHYFPHEILTPAADIYALSATLYYLLVGHPPTPVSLRMSPSTPVDLRSPAPGLQQCYPPIPSEVQQAILASLEIEAHRRPQTVETWLSLLGCDHSLRLPNPALQSVSAVNTASYSRQSHRWVPVVFVITAIVSGYLGFGITRKYALTPSMAQGGSQSSCSRSSSSTSFDLKSFSSDDFREPDPSERLFQELESLKSLDPESILTEQEPLDREVDSELEADQPLTEEGELLHPSPKSQPWETVNEIAPELETHLPSYDEPAPPVSAYHPDHSIYPDTERLPRDDYEIPLYPLSSDIEVIPTEPGMPVPPLPSLDDDDLPLPALDYTESELEFNPPPVDPYIPESLRNSDSRNQSFDS